MVGNIKMFMSSMGDRVLQIQILQDAFFTKNPGMAQLTLNQYSYK
jgi:hypothetical protein